MNFDNPMNLMTGLYRLIPSLNLLFWPRPCSLYCVTWVTYVKRKTWTKVKVNKKGEPKNHQLRPWRWLLTTKNWFPINWNNSKMTHSQLPKNSLLYENSKKYKNFQRKTYYKNSRKNAFEMETLIMICTYKICFYVSKVFYIGPQFQLNN